MYFILSFLLSISFILPSFVWVNLELFYQYNISISWDSLAINQLFVFIYFLYTGYRCRAWNYTFGDVSDIFYVPKHTILSSHFIL
jgi:hypothetical protein